MMGLLDDVVRTTDGHFIKLTIRLQELPVTLLNPILIQINYLLFIYFLLKRQLIATCLEHQLSLLLHCHP